MCTEKLNLAIKQLPPIAQGFFGYLKAENKAKNTIINYALDLKDWINYQFDSSNITADDFEKLKLEDLYGYVGELTDKKSSSTIGRRVGCIKSFYKYLDKFNYISKNPSIHLSSPKIEKQMPKYLVEDDMIKLLNSIKREEGRSGRCDSPERDYAILITFVSTGIRLSELIGIQLKDIHNGNLTVRGKGNKQREIPLSASCLKAIKIYLNVRTSHNNTLFVNKNGEKFTPNGVQQLVKRYLKKIGKEDFSTHKLRHSAISNMLQNGTDLRTLQEIAGHSSLTTTQIYTHVNSKIKQQAVNNTGLAQLNVV